MGRSRRMHVLLGGYAKKVVAVFIALCLSVLLVPSAAWAEANSVVVPSEGLELLTQYNAVTLESFLGKAYSNGKSIVKIGTNGTGVYKGDYGIEIIDSRGHSYYVFTDDMVPYGDNVLSIYKPVYGYMQGSPGTLRFEWSGTTILVSLRSVTGAYLFDDSFEDSNPPWIQNEKMNISDAQISKIDQQKWTGSAIEPKPSVVMGGKRLTEGRDYTLSYTDNVDIGVARVTVVGAGSYTGSKDIEFEICKANSADLFDISKASITFAGGDTNSAREYTGEAITPSVSVYMPGEAALAGAYLTEGVDYTVSYLNNVEVGQASVVVMGIGAYWGSKTAYFDIVNSTSKETDFFLPMVDGNAFN